MNKDNFYNLTIEEVEKYFNTSIESGLKNKDVSERLQKEGYNEFEKKKKQTLFEKFLNQFKSFMILVLLAAAIISGIVGYLEGEGFTDAIIILAIVLLNAIIGVIQEAKAEESLAALEKLSSPHCKVIRNGQIYTIESRELVVGDIVILETGDSVPADLRLIESVNLKIQEAALTGESVPEEKVAKPIEGDVALADRDNMAYASTSVSYGRGKGIVTATGMKSEVGKIASMIQSVPDTKTPLQIKLDKLGKTLGIAAIIICSIIFIVGTIYSHNVMQMFMTAVSLAAAAIPEGLPAVSTIVLAIGVQRLVKKNAIIRTLPAVETLGSTQVICSDKTGTLTQNRMTVIRLYVDGETESVSDIETLSDSQTLLLCRSILANDGKISLENDVWKTTGDPTETAMIDLGLKLGLNKNEVEKVTPRIAEIPFDSERKLMTTVNNDHGKFLVSTKGGLDELLSCCSSIIENGLVRELNEYDRQRITRANIAMAEKALRVLAVGMKEISSLPDSIEPAILEKDLVFIGLMGMIDPPREEVKIAVQECRAAGIKPVMITGDHKITAIAIAESLGIKNKEDMALSGLEVEKMSNEELRRNIDSISVYARVSPEHKVRIVKAFQERGEVVAMTGDGVNDAPALKLADIGVAMGITGTDVSKGAADVILTDDNFATIVSAVEEGRRIYDNILKAIQFMLSTNIGEILVLFIAVMANWSVPLLPIHILWINLVTDSLPALALSVDPAAPDVMKRKPIDSKQGIMNKAFATRILLQGGMIGGLSLAAYHIGLQANIEVAQTMTFAVLALCQITHVLNVRSTQYSAFKGMFNNKYLWGALAVVLGLMFTVLEIPALHDIFHVTSLSHMQWMWVAVLSIAPLPIMELVKLAERLFRKKIKQ